MTTAAVTSVAVATSEQDATAATGIPGSKKQASSVAASDPADGGGPPASGAVVANPSTAIAAVIVVNGAGEATPAAVNSAPSGAAIGKQSKISLQAALPPLAGQDAATAKEAAAAKPAAAGDTTTADPATPDPSAAAAPTASQAPASPDNSVLATAQQSAPADSQTAFQPLLNLAAGATNAAATGDGASGTQPAAGTTKIAASEVPGLGVVAAGTAASQTAAAVPDTPVAVAVPISALPVAIAARAKAGSSQFDIRLDPPDLGRIDVRLGVDANGRVTSHVTVDRPETLTLLQNQQPQLERALEQAGLKTADNGLQFSLRDQSFTGQNNNGGNAQPSLPQLVIHDPELASTETRQIYARVSLGGGIDIRV